MNFAGQSSTNVFNFVTGEVILGYGNDNTEYGSKSALESADNHPGPSTVNTFSEFRSSWNLELVEGPNTTPNNYNNYNVAADLRQSQAKKDDIQQQQQQQHSREQTDDLIFNMAELEYNLKQIIDSNPNPPKSQDFLSSIFRQMGYNRLGPELDNFPWPSDKPMQQNETSPNLTDIYKIDFDLILGRGAFGTVYSAKNRTTQAIVAVKYIERGDCTFGSIIKEFVVQGQMQSEFIVRFYNAFDLGEHIVIVMEQMEMDLEKFMKNEMPSIPVLHFICMRVVLGLDYLHERGIVHLDVKPPNVLLCGTSSSLPIAKLSDFGLSVNATRAKPSRDCAGTPAYMAPEVRKKEEFYMPADMWSYGVLVFECFMGGLPFDEQMNYENDTQFKPELCINADSDLTALIQELLVDEPEKRLTARDCIRHSFFTKSPSTIQ